jgi:hypothetical protein
MEFPFQCFYIVDTFGKNIIRGEGAAPTNTGSALRTGESPGNLRGEGAAPTKTGAALTKLPTIPPLERRLAANLRKIRLAPIKLPIPQHSVV